MNYAVIIAGTAQKMPVIEKSKYKGTKKTGLPKIIVDRMGK